MAQHEIRPLTPETYPAWLALAQKHDEVWGGCCCGYFHGDDGLHLRAPLGKRKTGMRIVVAPTHV